MKIKTKTNHGLSTEVSIDDYINPNHYFNQTFIIIIDHIISFLIEADNLAHAIDELLDSRFSCLLEADTSDMSQEEIDRLSTGGNEGKLYNDETIMAYETTIMNPLQQVWPTMTHDAATIKAGNQNFIVYNHPETNEMKFFICPQLAMLIAIVDAPDLFRVEILEYSHDEKSMVYDLELMFDEVIFYDNDAQFGQHEKLDMLDSTDNVLSKLNYIIDGSFNLSNYGDELLSLSNIIDRLNDSSISDDDICSTCTHCIYNPGHESLCSLNWPTLADDDGQIVSCNSFFDKTWRIS